MVAAPEADTKSLLQMPCKAKQVNTPWADSEVPERRLGGSFFKSLRKLLYEHRTLTDCATRAP